MVEGLGGEPVAYWKGIKYDKKSIVNTFGDGVNTGVPPFEIKEGEHTYSRNLESRDFPAVRTRPPRRHINIVGLSSNNAVYGVGTPAAGIISTHEDNTWNWHFSPITNYELTTSLGKAQSSIFNFDTGATAYLILMSSTDKRIYDYSSTATAITDSNAPYTYITAVHKNRIFAASGTTVHYCGLLAPTDWTTPNDAGSISLSHASSGICGMASFQDRLVIFTAYSMHELYGSGPATFSLVTVSESVGCGGHFTIVNVNDRLYWMGFNGTVYEYDGATIRSISDPIQHYIDNRTGNIYNYSAGAQDEYYYIAMSYGAADLRNNLILKFDTRTRKWFVENGAFDAIHSHHTYLYGVKSDDNTLWRMRDVNSTGGEGLDYSTNPALQSPISWSLITKPYQDGAVGERKSIEQVNLVADISTGSTSFSIGYSTNVHNNDSTLFTTLKTLNGSSEVQNEQIRIPPTQLNDVNWYRLRFAGTGDATIHQLQKNLRVRTR